MLSVFELSESPAISALDGVTADIYNVLSTTAQCSVRACAFAVDDVVLTDVTSATGGRDAVNAAGLGVADE
jgi:hypothetical protein